MTLVLAGSVMAADIALPGANDIVVSLAEAGLDGKPRPVIEVFGSGRVRFKGKALATKLSKSELQDLMRYVVETCKFFRFDQKKVTRTLKQLEPDPRCGVGFTTTHVRVSANGKRKKVSVELLANRAVTYREIEDLVNLHSIELRLRLEVKLAQSGGRKKVTEYLAAANARLKQRYPKLAPFKIEEFGGLTNIPKAGESILPAGWDKNIDKLFGECARFTRYVPGKIISATVRTDPKAKPRAAAQVQD